MIKVANCRQTLSYVKKKNVKKKLYSKYIMQTRSNSAQTVLLPIPVVRVFTPYVLAVGGEIVAWWAVYMTTAD